MSEWRKSLRRAKWRQILDSTVKGTGEMFKNIVSVSWNGVEAVVVCGRPEYFRMIL